MSYATRFLKQVQLYEDSRVSSADERQYQELIATLREKSYPEAVKYIDEIVKDEKLKFLLSLGFGGPLANVKLQSREIAIPIVNLLPTQHEIDLSKSLIYTLNGKSDLSVFFSSPVTVVAPLVTFNGTFIIDGHHRWSQAYCTNPDETISCIDFTGKLSPIQILKAVQATIGSNLGKLPSSTLDGQNMYETSREQIRKYIDDNLSPVSEKSLKELAKLPDRNAVVEFLTDNCIELKANNTPILNAPSRDIMPQTRKDPHSLSDMEAGVTKI